MLPTIKPGDSLLIQPLRSYNQKISLNEIVVFIRDEHIICHRVLYAFHIGGLEYYLEKGDNNLIAWIIRSDKILGKVIAVNDDSEIYLPPELVHGKNIFLKTIIFGLYRKFFSRSGKFNNHGL